MMHDTGMKRKSFFQKRVAIPLFFLVWAFSNLPHAFAQDTGSLTFTLTPPLFQLTIGPGESWASSIKVVNNNPYDIVLYASTMDFSSAGEEGQGKLIPVIEGDGEGKNTLGEWIEVSKDPFTVPRETSYHIPFSVQIPADAPPGGHYAALLVGTAPLYATTTGPTIRVSSLISSLFFVRIKGDIIEQGSIDVFRPNRRVYFHANPEVTFSLKFRNSGNVHVRPQGDVRVENMWGKEVAVLPLNQNTHFGNVLPESTRTYEMLWQGDSVWNIGLHRATITLTFGEDGHQNMDRTTYFWVIPLKGLLIILGIAAVVIGGIAFLVRRYIHRSLERTVQTFAKKDENKPSSK